VKAQDSDDATANASATIVTPITIDKTTDLNFGTIFKTPEGGTVTVTAAGTRSASGVNVLAQSPSQFSDFSAATFTVNGDPSATYTVTLPADGSVTISNGAETMAVSSFISNATGNLNASGQEVFGVGATLTVAANQASGVYTGTFDVTAAYN